MDRQKGQFSNFNSLNTLFYYDWAQDSFEFIIFMPEVCMLVFVYHQ